MTVKSGLLEILEQHKGETISGEWLAGRLGCTRAAVWKAVKALREDGYRIASGANKGYMLSAETNRLSAEVIRPYLNCQEASVWVYKEVDSTNRAAKQKAMDHSASHGSVVAASRQSAGRGRRGRSFFSPEGGLYLSVVLEPGETLQESLLLTTAAAVAVFEAVEKLCGISLDIKWVNDLYRDGKKVCGILTEAVTDFESGSIQFAVVGIGINLFQDPDTLPEELKGIAGSIFERREDAEKVDLNRLVAEIVNNLMEEMKDLKLSPVYVAHNMIPGHEIRILDGERSRKALALEICQDGRLLVLEEDGSRTALSYGEVSIRLDGNGEKRA